MMRLTQQWTKTAEEAYGPSGKIGRNGELWLAEILRKKGYNVEDSEESYTKQNKGIDLTISRSDLKRSYTIDVKTNLLKEGTFFIEILSNGWLLNLNKVSDCIWHVNPETSEMAWYSRNKMKAEVKRMLLKQTSFKQFFVNNKLLRLNIHELPLEMSFVKTSINTKSI